MALSSRQRQARGVSGCTTFFIAFAGVVEHKTKFSNWPSLNWEHVILVHSKEQSDDISHRIFTITGVRRASHFFYSPVDLIGADLFLNGAVWL